jgi:5S rRNA maturation endonuclease (ribonuclease M5)
MDLDSILAQLDKVRKSGDGWSARCPAHSDKNNSLSVGRGNDDRVLFHCHAGCSTESISSALGLEMRDLFNDLDDRGYTKNQLNQRRIIATYDYIDAEGELLYQGVRYEPKDFKQRRPSPSGGWIWSLKGVDRVLYNLPNLLKSDVESLVFIVEGEKDCDRLSGLGLLATTNVGGARNWLDEYNKYLVGRSVVILPDNDDAGKNHAEKVARSLHGVAASVKIVKLPNLPLKGDVSDYFDAGGTVEELIELANAAPIWMPTDGSDLLQSSFVSFVSSDNDASEEIEWPEPEEISSGLLPVPPLQAELIPLPLRDWLQDIADRAQCPLEFPAIGAFVGAAAVIGNQVGVCPKRKDDWKVIPNLWGGVVGRPGLLKSPSLAEVLRPVNRLVSEAREAYSQTIREYEIEDMVRQARYKNLNDVINKEIKQGGNPDVKGLRKQFVELEQISKPVERRYIVNDPTVEKLGELLNENPRGLLLFRDELVGWLRSLDKDGHENDRAFYLEAWNGDGSYTYDRIGRGTIHIPSVTLSVLGGIQPGPLSQYLRGALSGSKGDDGLLQRFQLLVYPDISKDWRNVDRWPDTEAKNRVFELYKRLDTLDPNTLCAVSENDNRVPYLRFSNEAQEFFDDWRAELERELRSEGAMHPALEAHLAKYRSLMPTLALLFHLFDTVTDQPNNKAISFASAELAAAWCDFLLSHAKRIYGLAIDSDVTHVRQLAEHIRHNDLPDPFTARDVYRKGWAGLNTVKSVDEPLKFLEDLGWIRAIQIHELGRPTVHYHINPKMKGRES